MLSHSYAQSIVSRAFCSLASSAAFILGGAAKDNVERQQIRTRGTFGLTFHPSDLSPSSIVSPSSLSGDLEMRKRRGRSGSLPRTDTAHQATLTDSHSSSSSSLLQAVESLRHLKYTVQLVVAYLLTTLYSLVNRTDRMALGIAKMWPRKKEEPESIGLVKRRRAVTGGTSGKRMGTLASGQGRRGADDTRLAGLADAVYFPGMVNLSGTLCYMNSVLQALASLPSLLDHLARITNLAVEVDLPTPVIDSLLDILRDLNTPSPSRPPALRPHALLQALSPLPPIQRLLSTGEQQDAHELFIVLTEAVANESLVIAKETAKLRGLGEVLSLQSYSSSKNAGKTKTRKRGIAHPWEGLVARRRKCLRCGWVESVRIDTLGGMELSIPLRGEATLESCIERYLEPENLSGVTCEMCSLNATRAYYHSEIDRLSNPSSSSPSSSQILDDPPDVPSSSTMTTSRKKRLTTAKKTLAKLDAMSTSLSPQPSPEIKWQTTRSDSLRETSITRPPISLRLHVIRSEYTPYGQLLKKTARVDFPPILDLTDFVSRGIWEESSSSLSGSGVLQNLEANKGQIAKDKPKKKVLYRLQSVILHYGYTHSSGHFISIRRKPSETIDSGSGECGLETTAKACPDYCTCEECVYFGQARTGTAASPGRGWLRISDADVDEVGEEELRACRGEVFMCFYERVGEYRAPGAPGGYGTAMSSPPESGRSGVGSSVASESNGDDGNSKQ
ncbi:ubiquitin carboxyl-terminal hydrolase 1, partial [Tremellales sp. Uapishka_1]